MSKLIQCPSCKVKYEAQDNNFSKEQCPICNKTQRVLVNVNSDKNKQQKSQGLETDSPEHVFKEMLISKRWKRLWLVSAAVLLSIPSAVVLLLNVFSEGKVTWSLIVVLSLVFSWFYLFVIVNFFRRWVKLLFYFLFMTSLFLLFLDIVIATKWSGILGLNIAIVWLVVVNCIIFCITKFFTNKIYMLIVILIHIVIGLLMTEVCIDYAIQQNITLTWSIVTSLSILPVVCLLFYLHKHRKFLHRWFHL